MKKGFTTVEVFLAAAIFITFATAIMTITVQGLAMGRLSIEQTQAEEFASEGIEIAKGIKNKDFALITNNAGIGTSAVASGWVFGGTSNTFDKFTRVIDITAVARDGGGNIVASGGTVDTNSKKVTSTVTWNFTPSRANSVVFSAYLTNFRKSIAGNWSGASLEANVDATGSTDGQDVVVMGTTAYLVRNASTNNFVVINVANTSSPTIVTAPAFMGNMWGISHGTTGNYAYLASTDNNQEFQIINVTSSSAPALLGISNLTNSDDARAVASAGNYAYVGRVNSGRPEFVIIDTTSPSGPLVKGSLDLNGTPNRIALSGNYAYVASTDDASELQIINISNPTSPSLAGVLALTGNFDGTSIAVTGTTVFLGRSNGELAIINASTPASASLTTTYITGTVSVTGLDTTVSGDTLFVCTSITTAGVKVLNVTTPASPTSIATLNLPGTATNIYYSPDLDRLFVTTAADTAELVIIKPV